MSNKFKVGDKVMCGVDKDDVLSVNIPFDVYNENIIIGEVIEVLKNKKLKVLWENQSFNVKIYNQKSGRIDRYDPIEVNADEVLTLEEGEQKVKDLEVDFKKVEKEISEKIRIAGDLVKQANDLAETVGASLNQIESAYELMDALRKGGWRTSSMSC
jgi:hypothetical protein